MEPISQGYRYTIEGYLIESGGPIELSWDPWNAWDPEKESKMVWGILQPVLGSAEYSRKLIYKFEKEVLDDTYERSGTDVEGETGPVDL